jgi:hypothetical protein
MKAPDPSPYRAWQIEQWRLGFYARNTSVARDHGAPLHCLRVCIGHSHNCRKCPAKRIQARLKRQGWFCSQYQGFVTTDAPKEEIVP